MLKTKDIVFICDDNYCMPTAVCIRSIIDNWEHINECVTVHVCTFGLNPDNVKFLQSLSAEAVSVVVDTFDINFYKDKIEKVSQRSHVTPTALIKFELANYYQNLNLLLYMDSDMVVKGDLYELLCTDIGESYIGASYEFYNHINRISYSLKRSVSKAFYFNSGMMLLNLKKMRDDDIPAKMWYYKLNKARTTLMDQESLNAICSTNTLQLPVKWNFNPIFLNKAYIKEINKVYGTKYTSLEDMEQDACIIHYVGSTDKPWNYENARSRRYWDIYYHKIYEGRRLTFKKIDNEKRSYNDAIKDKIRKHGVYGFICNMIYLLSERIKNA